MQKKEDAKLDQEMRLKEACTFRPAINQKSDAFARRSRGCLAEPLNERLYNDAGRRSKLRAQAKELLDANDLYECTFTPRINAQRNEGEARIPLHLRSEAIQQTKQARTRATQEALKKQFPLSFQPTLSARSHRLAERRKLEARRSASQDAFSPGEAARCMSSTLDGPKGSPVKRAASSDSTRRTSSLPQAFLERQQSYEEARRFRNRVRLEHAEADFTFRQVTAFCQRTLGSQPCSFVVQSGRRVAIKRPHIDFCRS
ncbi:HMG1 [Symbiodinium sp. CCMP2592]|nr:HMG1 [Symbiodinium sp. CCMP2592]